MLLLCDAAYRLATDAPFRGGPRVRIEAKVK